MRVRNDEALICMRMIVHECLCVPFSGGGAQVLNYHF